MGLVIGSRLEGERGGRDFATEHTIDRRAL